VKFLKPDQHDSKRVTFDHSKKEELDIRHRGGAKEGSTSSGCQKREKSHFNRLMDKNSATTTIKKGKLSGGSQKKRTSTKSGNLMGRKKTW